MQFITASTVLAALTMSAIAAPAPPFGHNDSKNGKNRGQNGHIGHNGKGYGHGHHGDEASVSTSATDIFESTATNIFEPSATDSVVASATSDIFETSSIDEPSATDTFDVSATSDVFETSSIDEPSATDSFVASATSDIFETSSIDESSVTDSPIASATSDVFETSSLEDPLTDVPSSTFEAETLTESASPTVTDPALIEVIASASVEEGFVRRNLESLRPDVYSIVSELSGALPSFLSHLSEQVASATLTIPTDRPTAIFSSALSGSTVSVGAAVELD
ncbi:hypothetical protein BD626DRAFT_583456 [Schizophyllum amplum]|uniref:Uncharacterized protein n=1 Tax=Schizophyllum amplum TaxID=97359 RepID=A0A550CFI3_9AGAR|nr:hypothetical protein BD626DRAFT_583456 [Auriculariopsis ampla]